MLPNVLDGITAKRKDTGGLLSSGASPHESPIEDDKLSAYLLDDAPDSTTKGRRDIASRTIFLT
jgi:hypothetical protein